MYNKEIFVAPTNMEIDGKNYRLLPGGRDQWLPKMSSQVSGLNWMDKEYQMLYVLLRGK